VQLWPPLRFRFVEPEDVEKYGSAWYVYDEAALIRLRFREQAALEEAVDMPLIEMIRGMHDRQTVPTAAGMWVVLHRLGVGGPWKDFDPLVHLVEWEKVPAEAPLDSGVAPAPDSSSSTAPPAAEESVSS
jgi:hypothetical protein